MAIQLSNIQRDIHTAKVEWNGETSLIKFRPGSVNGKNIKKVVKAMEDDDLNPLFAFLVETIIDWDLRSEDGQTFTMTREGVEELPLTFVRSTFKAIMGASEDVGERPSS